MKKFLSLVLALVMTMSLVTVSAGAKDFTDNDELNYAEAIAVMSELKVVGGYTDGSFNPQGNLTRQAAAKIICNLILGPTTASALRADTAPFKDVAVDNQFAGYITYCAQQGIINGYADGTFRPGAPLTGYAFMKMLLGALGYDAQIEGYVGPNWSVQVAKRAIGIGLNDGLVDTFNGVKTVNREEACLYAFNTLQATMVEYDSRTTVSVGGAEVVIAGSEAQNVAQTGYKNTVGDKDTLEFAEKYFPKLNVEVVDGVYGRPSNKWTLNKKEIGTFASIAPAFVYTEGVEEKEIYKDLGDAMDYDRWDAFVDGESVTVVEPTKGKTNDWTYTGAGSVTEVYVDDDDEKVTVVEINYYLGQVAKVKEDDDGEYVTVTALSEVKLSDKKFYTEGFEEEDLIVFTVDRDEDDKAVIREVFEPETVTGEVTRVENDKNSNRTYLRVDGEKHAYSAHNVYDLSEAGTKQHPALKEEYNLYTDPNGFVVGFEPAEETIDEYLYVLDVHAGLRKEATVLLATGEEVDIRIDEMSANNDAKVTDVDQLLNEICTYTVDDRGIYDLEIQADAHVEKWDSKGSEINEGRAYMDTEGRGTVIVDNKTTFVDYDGETAYVGYKEVPSFEDATLAYVMGGKIAKVVFVLQGEKYDDGSVLFVLADDHFETLKYDGKWYREYEVYVDGETQTMYVREDQGKLATGVLYQVNKTIDEEYITKVSEIADFDSAREVETVGVDAFWTVKKEGETFKDNQWDVESETTFVVVDFEEDGDIDSIYEGKLKHMDDEDYSIRVYVAKSDDQTAELVYIFRMPVDEVVEVPVDGAVMIGNTGYNTLAEAVNAAKAGDTIVLNQDIILSESVNLPEDVTLDGKDNTIFCFSENYAICLKSRDVVKNVVLKGTGTADWNGIYGLEVYKATDVVIEDVEISKFDAAIYVNGSEVTLKGTVNVSGNEFGGIEVSQGAGVTEDAVLNVQGTVVNTTEVVDDVVLPTVWTVVVDGVAQGSVIGKIQGWSKNPYNGGDKTQIWWTIG